ncbi:DUF2889 domain-containing protein [Marinomonas epiphytica]
MKRTLMHSRRIESKGYLREDGLWEVEASMTDLKAHDTTREYEGTTRPAGSLLHNMSLTLTLDDTFLIKGVSVSMKDFPFPNCFKASDIYTKLVGTRIGGGWNKWIKAELAGIQGCTHILELLPVVATTAFQTMWQPLGKKYPKQVPFALNKLVNSCQGWSHTGPMVTKLVEEQVIQLPVKGAS